MVVWCKFDNGVGVNYFHCWWTIPIHDLSKRLKKLESDAPGLCINLNGALSNQIEDDSIVVFNDCEILACKHIFSEYSIIIWGLEVYMLNGKQYMTSTSQNKMNISDMSSKTLSTTLVGHESVFLLWYHMRRMGYKCL